MGSPTETGERGRQGQGKVTSDRQRGEREVDECKGLYFPMMTRSVVSLDEIARKLNTIVGEATLNCVSVVGLRES